VPLFCTCCVLCSAGSGCVLVQKSMSNFAGLAKHPPQKHARGTWDVDVGRGTTDNCNNGQRTTHGAGRAMGDGRCAERGPGSGLWAICYIS
jgi:hypothetical protein